MKVSFFLLFFISSVSSHCMASINWTGPMDLKSREAELTGCLLTNYDESEPRNATLNNSGSEFDHFEKLELDIFNLPKEKFSHILEIGGGYGRFMRNLVASMIKNDYNQNSFSYYFSDVEPNQVKIARLLFAQKFPQTIHDQILFASTNAEEVLKKSNHPHRLIIINNLLHFFSPEKVVDTMKTIKERFPNATIILSMTTHHYDEEKKYVDIIKTVPNAWHNHYVSDNELRRQGVESRKRDGTILFPGYFNNHYFLNKENSSFHYFDAEIGKRLFGMHMKYNVQSKEFSEDHTSCYQGRRVFVSFILTPSQEENETVDWDFLLNRAREEEILSKTFHPEFDLKDFKREWQTYLGQLTKESVSLRGSLHFQRPSNF